MSDNPETQAWLRVLGRCCVRAWLRVLGHSWVRIRQDRELKAVPQRQTVREVEVEKLRCGLNTAQSR